MEIYVTADLHLGHKLMHRIRPFGEDHDKEIIARWNRTVNPKDTVWVLGDVVFPQSHMTLLGELNGIKKLVLGNHDLHRMEAYQKYFSRIYGAFEMKDCILTHIPVHRSELDRYKKNIHGHLHEKGIVGPYKCVSLEQTNYFPILLKPLLEV